MSPVFWYDVTLLPTVAIWLNDPDDSVARSILNPASFAELSFQESLIWLEEMAVAIRLLGGDGVSIAVVVVVISVAVVVGSKDVVVIGG